MQAKYPCTLFLLLLFVCVLCVETYIRALGRSTLGEAVEAHWHLGCHLLGYVDYSQIGEGGETISTMPAT